MNGKEAAADCKVIILVVGRGGKAGGGGGGGDDIGCQQGRLSWVSEKKFL